MPGTVNIPLADLQRIMREQGCDYREAAKQWVASHPEVGAQSGPAGALGGTQKGGCVGLGTGEIVDSRAFTGVIWEPFESLAPKDDKTEGEVTAEIEAGLKAMRCFTPEYWKEKGKLPGVVPGELGEGFFWRTSQKRNSRVSHGLPDMAVWFAGWHFTLMFEIKRRKGGQFETHQEVCLRAGAYYVVRSFAQVRAIIHAVNRGRNPRYVEQENTERPGEAVAPSGATEAHAGNEQDRTGTVSVRPGPRSDSRPPAGNRGRGRQVKGRGPASA